jgi:hypothetical protein
MRPQRGGSEAEVCRGDALAWASRHKMSQTIFGRFYQKIQRVRET